MSATLADQADKIAAAAEVLALPPVAIRSAFMAGALAVVTSNRPPHDELLAECLAYVRSIGTPAERATITTTTTTTAKETA